MVSCVVSWEMPLSSTAGKGRRGRLIDTTSPNRVPSPPYRSSDATALVVPYRPVMIPACSIVSRKLFATACWCCWRCRSTWAASSCLSIWACSRSWSFSAMAFAAAGRAYSYPAWIPLTVPNKLLVIGSLLKYEVRPMRTGHASML